MKVKLTRKSESRTETLSIGCKMIRPMPDQPNMLICWSERAALAFDFSLRIKKNGTWELSEGVGNSDWHTFEVVK